LFFLCALRVLCGERFNVDDRRLNILLVEDDEDDYVLVKDLLGEIEGGRFRLEWASSYEAAIEAIQRAPHDVYLVDYRLGARTGLEFLREAAGMGCRAPMILLTGQGGREIDVEAMKAGAADYLAKGQLDSALLERSIRYAMERARTLEALRRSEEGFRAIVETTPIPMAITRLSDGAILYANDSLAQVVGLPTRGLIGRPASDFYSDSSDCETLLDLLNRDGCVRNREVVFKRADGAPFWALVSFQAMTFNDEQAVLVGLYDITDRKRTEQELIRLERLRALGEMSAGVSHNLNNILVGVLGPAQLLYRKMEDPQALRQVEGIITSARRARDLVQRLHRAVLGGEEGAWRPVEVNRVVREAVQAAQPRWKDESEARGISIRVGFDLQEGLPEAQGTEAGLHDILINLLFNAVDAMPEGGEIRIKTGVRGQGSGKARTGVRDQGSQVKDQSRVQGPESRVEGSGLRTPDSGLATGGERWVEVVVADTGIGMDEKTRGRVFEPFFTTKLDVGTGLGLATVYGTVTRWGGHVEVKSAPGRGATFTLLLPVWVSPGVRAQGPAKVRRTRRARRGRVLVVEDDLVVLDLLSDLLSADHEVEMVQSGAEALERFRPGRYDMVLIDLGMPEMPGDQVAREMRRMDACVATVLITGWELGEADPRLSGFDLHIRKPFEDLDRVQDALAQGLDLHDARAAGRAD
jgi:PAS domain S-box-containing protein